MISQVKALMPAELASFVSSVLVYCLDIRAMWLVGYADGALALPAKPYELVLFADAGTLAMLRRSDHLHHADVHALVVFDGEQFESAWGPERNRGSLARWAWRQDGPDLAYYNETKWARGGEAGIVVRVRRKAVLVWRALHATS